jgi:hypothetical protein
VLWSEFGQSAPGDDVLVARGGRKLGVADGGLYGEKVGLGVRVGTITGLSFSDSVEVGRIFSVLVGRAV